MISRTHPEYAKEIGCAMADPAKKSGFLHGDYLRNAYNGTHHIDIKEYQADLPGLLSFLAWWVHARRSRQQASLGRIQFRTTTI